MFTPGSADRLSSTHQQHQQSPVGASIPPWHCLNSRSWAGHGQQVPGTERDPPERAPDLVISWQPVLDSNPYRHLERAIRSVRRVLPSAMPYGLSRANATTESVEHRAVPASHRWIQGQIHGHVAVGEVARRLPSGCFRYRRGGAVGDWCYAVVAQAVRSTGTEVAAECFADDVRRGGVLGGSAFVHCSSQLGIESDG